MLSRRREAGTSSATAIILTIVTVELRTPRSMPLM
jgi:hypothetical protein